jgi:hypothetical protein
MSGAIRRYTELPFLLDFLRTREIALLSPSSWDDKNDAHYLDAYAKAKAKGKGPGAVRALCMTEASETYHHWKVFSSGSSGMCIVFKKDRLLQWVAAQPLLTAGPVTYKTLNDLRAEGPSLDELPFLKRQAFKDEMEFRLFAMPQPATPGPWRLAMPLSVIDRIVMNPWLPKSVADHVKATLQSIEGCKTLKVYRSTLVDNEAWKRFAVVG